MLEGEDPRLTYSGNPSIAEPGSPLTLRIASLIFLALVIGAAAAASLGILDRDACLDAGGRWITERGACEVPEGTTFVPITRRGGVWLTWGSMTAIAIALAAWAYVRGTGRRRVR